MAKKALFHLVRFQDGHRKWKEVQAAGSKTAIGTAERSPHVRAEVEKAIGWHAIKAFPNDLDQVSFSVTINDEELIVEMGQPGYGYLCQQFPDQVQQVKEFLEREHGV